MCLRNGAARHPVTSQSRIDKDELEVIHRRWSDSVVLHALNAGIDGLQQHGARRLGHEGDVGQVLVLRVEERMYNREMAFSCDLPAVVAAEVPAELGL